MPYKSAFSASALPANGSFVAGTGSIAGGTHSLTVNQTSGRGIINWQSFSIGAGNTVQFNNGTGATLNRVTGGDLSSIAGALRATGSVYLINPSGVIVLPGGQVTTTGSFVAATRDMSNDDFMSGAKTFLSGTSAGTVVNQGSINSANGDVVLVGKAVTNDGAIAAPNGKASLVAGDQVLLQPAGASHVFVKATLGSGDVTNDGTITAAQVALDAAGGSVYALAGNSDGVISATGTAYRDGHVWLVAGNDVHVDGTVRAQNADGSGGKIDIQGGATAGAVVVRGTVQATGKNGNGGAITATAAAVALGSTAIIDASGATKGGTILLGGDRHGGQDPALKLIAHEIANAKTTIVAPGAQIQADGGTGGNGVGDGGNVVVWSDATTIDAGAISARGGAVGGFVEVSSEATLDYTGTANTTAAQGQTGTLLLDPLNIDIQDAYFPGDAGFDDPAGQYTNINKGLYTWSGGSGQILATQGAGNNSNLSPASISAALATTDVVLQASNNIALHFSSSGIKSTSGNSLAIEAGNDVDVGQDFTKINITGGLYLYGGVTGFTSTFTAHAIATPTFGATGNVFLAGNTTYSVGALGMTVGSAQPVSIGTDPVTFTSAGPIDFSRAPSITLSVAAIFNSSAGNGAITLPSVAGGSNALTLNAGSGTITLDAVTAGTLTITSSGTVDASAGALTVTGLRALGAGGTYTLTNAGNAIATLAANTGSLDLVDAADLTIGTVGGTTGVATTNGITLDTSAASKNLQIAAGAAISNSGAQDVLIRTNNFTNNAGAGAITAGGRWLVYAANQATSTTGGLDGHAAMIVGQTFATQPPASIVGNAFVFAAGVTAPAPEPAPPQTTSHPPVTIYPETEVTAPGTQTADPQSVLTQIDNEIVALLEPSGEPPPTTSPTASNTSDSPASNNAPEVASSGSPSSSGPTASTSTQDSGTPSSSPQTQSASAPATGDQEAASSAPSNSSSPSSAITEAAGAMIDALSSSSAADSVVASLSALAQTAEQSGATNSPSDTGSAFANAFVDALAQGASVDAATAIATEKAGEVSTALSSTDVSSPQTTEAQQLASGDAAGVGSNVDATVFQDGLAQGESVEQAFGEAQAAAEASENLSESVSVSQSDADALTTALSGDQLGAALSSLGEAGAKAAMDSLASGANGADALSAGRAVAAAEAAANAPGASAQSAAQQTAALFADGDVKDALTAAGLDPSDLNSPCARALGQSLAAGVPAQQAIADAQSVCASTANALAAGKVATSLEDDTAAAMATGHVPAIPSPEQKQRAVLETRVALPPAKNAPLAQSLASGKASPESIAALSGGKNAAAAFATGGSPEAIAEKIETQLDAQGKALAQTTVSLTSVQRIVAWTAAGELTPTNRALAELAKPLTADAFIKLISDALRRGESLENAAADALATAHKERKASPLSLSYATPSARAGAGEK